MPPRARPKSPRPRPRSAGRLLRAYARAHDLGVAGRGWGALAALFAPGGVLRFEGIVAGPYAGRPAIRSAFERRGPTDRLLVGTPRTLANGHARAAYRWASAPKAVGGSLELIAARGSIRELVVRTVSLSGR